MMTEKKSTASSPKRTGFRRVRMIVALAVFLSVAVGLAIHSGWGTLSSMGYRAIALICPLGALETLVAGGFGVSRVIAMVLVMVALVVLMGRFFCSWVCPVPPVQRFFFPKGRKGSAAEPEAALVAGVEPEAEAPGESAGESGTLQLTAEDEAAIRAEADALMGHAGCKAALTAMGGKRDGIRLDSRHGVLLGALLSTAVFGFPVFCLVCPVGLTIGTFLALWAAFVQQTPTWSLVVFPAILVLELVVLKKWCHTLCPMGALMSLLGAKSPVLKPQVNREKCLREQGVDCRVCVNACPEEVDPHSANIGECTKCGACAEACPAGAIHLKAFSLGKR